MPSSKTAVETESPSRKRSRFSANSEVDPPTAITAGPLNFAGHSPKDKLTLPQIQTAINYFDPTAESTTQNTMAEQKLSNLESLISDFIKSQKTSTNEIKESLELVHGDTSVIRNRLDSMADRFDSLEKDVEEIKEAQDDLKSRNKENCVKIQALEDAQLQAMDRLNPNYLILNGLSETADEKPEDIVQHINSIIRVNLRLLAPCTTA